MGCSSVHNKSVSHKTLLESKNIYSFIIYKQTGQNAVTALKGSDGKVGINVLDIFLLRWRWNSQLISKEKIETTIQFQ